jgi:hypothetical protein
MFGLHSVVQDNGYFRDESGAGMTASGFDIYNGIQGN